MQVDDDGECIDHPAESTPMSLFISQRVEHHVHKDKAELILDPYTTNNGEDEPRPQQMLHAEIL